MNQLTDDKPSTPCLDGEDGHLTSIVAAYATLKRCERNAALTVLAGRLAHQIRNSLAAIQSACNSLREEIQDRDHQERIDLILQEVTRMVGIISTEVQAVERPQERPRVTDAVGEIARIVNIAQALYPQAPEIKLRSQLKATCVAPLKAFRVAIFCLLEHLVETPFAKRVSIIVYKGNDLLHIRFSMRTKSVEENATLDTMTTPQGAWVDSIRLQIAERAVRDSNGRLKRWVPENGAQVITLDLPCADI